MTLLLRPKSCIADDLVRMYRQVSTSKERAWLLSYVIVKSGHAAALRDRWFGAPEPVIAAGRDAGPRDLTALLDRIEAEMAPSPGGAAVVAERGPGPDRRKPARTSRPRGGGR
ncbi:hypothetical protein [Corynebacterium sp.]|uniref:hypothetical protein n=1 Tax=Corynebacterium sp. TaxID=1720 RepID=UPI0025BC0E72|nr:hypothetical protein [Corynebacterium sp.]